MILTYIVIGIVVGIAGLLCFCLAVASFSNENFLEKHKENSARRNTAGITTLEYVSQINDKYFNGKLKVMKCPDYQDHYTTGIVALSEKTMASNSLASIATISHELGHARQDKEGDKLKKYWAMRRAGIICGFFFMPISIAGIILSILSVFKVLEEIIFLYIGLSLIGFAVLIFLFALFLKFKEIKIEKEASVYALDFVREYLTEQEVAYIKEFLDSARLTYWATLFRTMLGWTFLTKRDSLFR